MLFPKLTIAHNNSHWLHLHYYINRGQAAKKSVGFQIKLRQIDYRFSSLLYLTDLVQDEAALGSRDRHLQRTFQPNHSVGVASELALSAVHHLPKQSCQALHPFISLHASFLHSGAHSHYLPWISASENPLWHSTLFMSPHSPRLSFQKPYLLGLFCLGALRKAQRPQEIFAHNFFG